MPLHVVREISVLGPKELVIDDFGKLSQLVGTIKETTCNPGALASSEPTRKMISKETPKTMTAIVKVSSRCIVGYCVEVRGLFSGM